MTSERRRSTRHDIQFAVQLEQDGQGLECSGEDLSTGGLRLQLPDGPSLTTGDRVELSFRIPALADPVQTNAIVRWVDSIDDRMCGLQFTTGLRAREVWAINKIVDATSHQ